MDINSMTVGELKEIAAIAAGLGGGCAAKKTHSIPVGDKVFVRTVTMSYTGRVAAVTDYDMVLEDAAWIPDTGRFAAFLADGTLNEVEPFPALAILPLGAIVDISPWNHELPRQVK